MSKVCCSTHRTVPEKRDPLLATGQGVGPEGEDPISASVPMPGHSDGVSAIMERVTAHCIKHGPAEPLDPNMIGGQKFPPGFFRGL